LAAQNQYDITIVNYDKYKGRTDVTHNSWFRLSNRFLEDPDFFDFMPEEKLVWIYILSIASQKNSAKISINLNHASRICSLKKVSIDSALEKLCQINCLSIDVTGAVRDSEVTLESSALHNITRHNITEQDNTQHAPESLQSVVDLWNSFSQLPKVKALTDSRKKKLKSRLSEPAFDYQKAIPMILESDFLLGRTGNWKASFDWFIENETNYLKVLEGNYSKQNAKAKPSPGQNAFDVAKAQIDAINRGEL
jgi:hypothetical protein